MPPETHQISTRPSGAEPGFGPETTENTGVTDANVDHHENPDELDVRSLPHGGRHEVIFAKLDQLLPGHTFVILNDHDPKPLRYQTEAQWPGRFAWSYLETGPLLWRVAITRAR